MGRERLEIEFGRYAGWLAEAVTATAPHDPVPAACRGTGNPELFQLVTSALDLSEHMLVLDVGCGIGGPGAWIRANAGCMVVGVDVMEDAARGARLLFPESRIAVASSRSLPFAEHTFDAAIALGVLETIADKRSALREIGRVLATGARLCVYTYLWAEEEVPEAPVADRFQTCTAFEEEIDAVGLERIDARVFNGFGTTPGSWREAARVAHREVERLHGSDPLFIEAVAEMNKIARLISQRAVQPWLYVLRGP